MTCLYSGKWWDGWIFESVSGFGQDKCIKPLQRSFSLLSLQEYRSSLTSQTCYPPQEQASSHCKLSSNVSLLLFSIAIEWTTRWICITNSTKIISIWSISSYPMSYLIECLMFQRMHYDLNSTGTMRKSETVKAVPAVHFTRNGP